MGQDTADRDRNDRGRYNDRIPPADVLDVFADRADQARPLTAGDVVDALDIARRTAHNKLNQLVERGELETRKVGAHGRVWWTPDRGDAESGREPVETPAEGLVDRQDAPTGGPAMPPHTTIESGQDSDPVGDALDGWEPDTDANPRTARSQTRRAAEWLRGVGEFRRAGEFKDALAGDSTLGERSWWERSVQPGLQHLADHGLVEHVRNRGYRWVGDDGEV